MLSNKKFRAPKCRPKLADPACPACPTAPPARRSSKCVYQRFDDQTHGFVAARGDWTKPEVAAAAGKAIGIMADFLKHAMLDPPAEKKNGGAAGAAAHAEAGHGHHGTSNSNHPGHGEKHREKSAREHTC